MRLQRLLCFFIGIATPSYCKQYTFVNNQKDMLSLSTYQKHWLVQIWILKVFLQKRQTLFKQHCELVNMTKTNTHNKHA